jgi:hypothetical protein
MNNHPKIVSAERSPIRLHDPRAIFFGPFITRVVGTNESGNTCVITSRRHRKKLQPLLLLDFENLIHEEMPRKIWFQFWAPKQFSWWMAIFFMIGSALFGLGAALAIFPSILTPWWHIPTINNLVFFVGSIFFTMAGLMQFFEVVNADIADILKALSGATKNKLRWHFFIWRPRSLGYLACVTQVAGTILFNFNTGDTFYAGLSTTEQNIIIWSPNMLGSIFFLASSVFAYMEVAHRMGYFHLTDITIWMALLNFLGSVAFQISAVASFVQRDGYLLWLTGTNWGTFLGGICFLVASYLLIPELFEEEGAIAQKKRAKDTPSPAGPQGLRQGA